MFCINVQYNQVRLGSAQHAVGCAVPCTKTCCRRDILRKAGPARQRVQYWTHTRHGAQRSNMHYAGEGLITNVASVTLCVGELFKTRPTAHGAHGTRRRYVHCAVSSGRNRLRHILRQRPVRDETTHGTRDDTRRHGTTQRHDVHCAGEGLITNVASVTLCVGELFKTRPTAHSTRDTTTLRTGHNDTTCTVLAKARTRTSPSHFASDDCSRRDDTQHAAHGTRRRYVHCAVSCQELSPSHIASESCSGRDDTQHTAIEQQ